MLLGNQETPSKLRLTIACCILTSMLCAPAASGDTIFFDNFNDGDAEDGMPVTWAPSLGTWDASSGDYVATGSIPRVSLVTDHVLGDTSVRAQVRVTGTIHAGLALRRPQPLVGYAGEIRANGTTAIARIDGAGAVFVLDTAAVPFNPVDQDILLQFDAFGDKLSLWAWPVGESMPDEPQVVAFDTTYPEGPAGLISAAFVAAPSDSTTFRFVHVATTHLTAPSLTGDYNQNGVVDSADYVVWRNGVGTTYTQNDYDVWRAHFGQTAGSGAAGYGHRASGPGASAEPLSAAVPEPTTLLVFLIGALEAYCCRRKRR